MEPLAAGPRVPTGPARLMHRAGGTILDDMEQVVAAAVIDAHGIVTGWSEGARLLTGHPAEEAVGRTAADLLAEELPPRADGDWTGPVVVRHRDGRPVTLVVSACPVLGPDGRRTGYTLSAQRPAATEPTLAGRAFEQASMSMSVFDPQQRYLRLNEVACKVMGVPEDVLLGRHFPDTVADVEPHRGFDWHLRQVAETGRPIRYESFTSAPSLNREHAWTTEMWPVRDASGEVAGVALAAFDSTEQYLARQRLTLLNEAAASIGTTLDVVRTTEEVVELLVPRFADFVSVDLLDWVLGADEPPPVPSGEVVLRRVAHGSAQEGTPEAAVRLGETDVHPPFSPPARALREGRAIRIQAGEPDFVSWLAERNARAPEGRPFRTGVHSVISVPLKARGTTLGVLVGVRIAHFDDYEADDAVFAEELASRAAVCIDNARRFARERTTALALQSSLLPRGLSGQAAVEVAHRYLPAAPRRGSAATGSTSSRCPGAGSPSSSATSSDTASPPRRPWAACARPCAPSPTWTCRRTNSSPTWTTSSPTWRPTTRADEDVAELGATCLYAVYDPVSRRADRRRRGPSRRRPWSGPTAPCNSIGMTPGPPLGVGRTALRGRRAGTARGSPCSPSSRTA